MSQSTSKAESDTLLTKITSPAPDYTQDDIISPTDYTWINSLIFAFDTINANYWRPSFAAMILDVESVGGVITAILLFLPMKGLNPAFGALPVIQLISNVSMSTYYRKLCANADDKKYQLYRRNLPSNVFYFLCLKFLLVLASSAFYFGLSSIQLTTAQICAVDCNGSVSSLAQGSLDCAYTLLANQSYKSTCSHDTFQNYKNTYAKAQWCAHIVLALSVLYAGTLHCITTQVVEFMRQGLYSGSSSRKDAGDFEDKKILSEE